MYQVDGAYEGPQLARQVPWNGHRAGKARAGSREGMQHHSFADLYFTHLSMANEVNGVAPSCQPPRGFPHSCVEIWVDRGPNRDMQDFPTRFSHFRRPFTRSGETFFHAVTDLVIVTRARLIVQSQSPSDRHPLRRVSQAYARLSRCSRCRLLRLNRIGSASPIVSRAGPRETI